MSAKTAFISSTFLDLKQHRQAAWEVLTKFDVSVLGMEQFGARTTGPLETCLAEVGQCDVYVGIIAFRLGSIDAESGQSFTELEYNHAVKLKKEILIYLADEDALFPASAVDTDPKRQPQLLAFKKRLRDRHTVVTFSTPDDLATKLTRDFQRQFESREPEPESGEAQEFEKSAKTLRAFLLTPARFNGTEVRLSVAFNYGPYAASRVLCQRFNLEYGSTIGIAVRIKKPDKACGPQEFTQLYATTSRIDDLLKLKAEKNGELYAALLFTPEDVKTDHAKFFGYNYDHWELHEEDDGTVYVPPEGKIIMLYTKPA